MVARNLLLVAVAPVQTKGWLCHDLKNTDIKIRFLWAFRVVDLPPLFEGICSQSIMDANMQLQKSQVSNRFMIPEDMLVLAANFIVDIRQYLIQF